MSNPEWWTRWLARGGVALIAAGGAGCASVPRFEPTIPIEKIQSTREGIFLCHEYRIPSPSRRPADLRPYLNCLEDVKNIQARDLRMTRMPIAEAFEVFNDEFHLRYGLLREPEWTPELGGELEAAIQTALRGLWRYKDPTSPPVMATADEKRLFLKHFPDTAHRLGVEAWKVRPSQGNTSIDPRLEWIRASVAGGMERGVHCSALFRLRSEVDSMTMLWQDILDVSALQKAIPSLNERYQKKLDAARRELDSLRAQPEKTANVPCSNTMNP